MDLEVLGSSPRGGTIPAPALSGFSRAPSAERSVCILGGGVVGLVLGLRLARAGRRTTIVDPAPLGANASGVAAGMVAPASEALDLGDASFQCLRRARDRWSSLAASLGIELDRSGAVHMSASDADVDPAVVLDALGARTERADAPSWVSPALGGRSVWTPEDWRLEPGPALVALQQAFLHAGGRWIVQEVASPAEVAAFDADTEVVVAMGWGASACAALAPELARLRPIKGQILRLDAGPRSGPVLRHRGLYLAPTPHGLIVGATMEAGASDLAFDEARLDELHDAATEIAPLLAAAPRTAAVGVRAATPDGWPLVGRASTGVWLSVGARRNGWLLAPLMAEVLHAALDGSPHTDAEAFSPTRFDGE